jgi:hypothetical protein
LKNKHNALYCIIEKIHILESLYNKNGKIIIELLIKEDKSKNVVSENYSKDRTVKKDIIEIALFNKIVKYLILLIRNIIDYTR